jgi:MOSC domain-containing protein YiiM
MTPVCLEALMTGPVQPLGPRTVPSGIAKVEVAEPILLRRTGFDGDAQGDTLRHGGPEKAVHHYPLDHYAAWRSELGPEHLLDRPGAFGENLSTLGLTERDVAIGDVFEIGTAQIEISQGRQPCWKLNERFGLADMARRVQSSGRIGWYYRVLREGTVGPDDRMRLLHRHSPEWTISRIWRVLYVDPLNRSELGGVAEIERLADGCRKYAIRRLATGEVEDWTQRLSG